MKFSSREQIDFEIEGHSLQDLCNIHEQAVLEAMRELYAGKTPPCSCPLCIEDIYALALNALPPRYVQATRLDAYLQSPNVLKQAEIRRQVKQAARKVKQKPNHL